MLLVVVVGEVLKKYYVEDNRENCYKKMFFDDEYMDIFKVVFGVMYCVLKDVKWMFLEMFEDVSELFKVVSVLIV